MLKQLIEYACPTCNAGYGATPEHAGTSHNCGHCKTNFLVPVGLRPRAIEVAESAFIAEVSPREAAAVRNTVPVRMTLPNGLGGLAVPVSPDTANSMAKTFLGGLLVAIGVALAAMIGIRKRS